MGRPILQLAKSTRDEIINSLRVNDPMQFEVARQLKKPSFRGMPVALPW